MNNLLTNIPIKKYLLKIVLLNILLFNILINNINADIWDDIVDCTDDPCNCGSEEEITEVFGGIKQTYTPDRLCRPWNKWSGRKKNTCLLKKKPPATGDGYYSNLCIEETSDNSYFHPKVRVRTQQCNNIFCFFTEKTLAGHGDCRVFAGAYSFPMHRMCARIALPEMKSNKGKNLDADPGYTDYEHVNVRGETKEDEDKNLPKLPKLCVYEDPGLLTISTDLFDVALNYQPYHKTKDLHPVARKIKKIGDFFEGLSKAGMKLITHLSVNLMTAGVVNTDKINKLVDKIIDKIPEGLNPIAYIAHKIAEKGQVNRIVEQDKYGCVNIPLGPYPNPFCPDLSMQNMHFVNLYKICAKQEVSTVNKPCVKSDIKNNFIHNSVRVAFNNLVPFCTKTIKENCVKIKDSDSIPRASDMHNKITNQNDILHLCKYDSRSPCLNIVKNENNLCSHSGSCKNARVIYANMYINSSEPDIVDYYNDNVDDCVNGESDKALCKIVWGVDFGDFKDVVIDFKSDVTTSELDKSTKFSLVDSSGDIQQFSASVVVSDTNNSNPKTSDMTQTSNQICVYTFGNNLKKMVGCVDRMNDITYKAYKCSSDFTKPQCKSDMLSPKVILSLESDDDDVNLVLEAINIRDSNYQEKNNINLFGKKISNFVTDNEGNIAPFHGVRAFMGHSFFGVYKDDKYPIDENNRRNKDAKYLYGLEYIKGKYNIGGEKICLNIDDIGMCPDEKNQCVLTKLKNHDVIDCKLFNNEIRKYSNPLLCKDIKNHNNKCKFYKSLRKKDGSLLSIRKCNMGQSEKSQKYCYDSDKLLCQVSHDYQDRIFPSSDFGPKLKKEEYFDISKKLDQQYQDPNATGELNNGASFDRSRFAIRNKTADENDFCVDIDIPTCKEEENDYTKWNLAKFGEKSIGSCKNTSYKKKFPNKPLERYCTYDFKTKDFRLEKIDDDTNICVKSQEK